jgi:hypothetical protein
MLCIYEYQNLTRCCELSACELWTQADPQSLNKVSAEGSWHTAGRPGLRWSECRVCNTTIPLPCFSEERNKMLDFQRGLEKCNRSYLTRFNSMGCEKNILWILRASSQGALPPNEIKVLECVATVWDFLWNVGCKVPNSTKIFLYSVEGGGLAPPGAQA